MADFDIGIRCDYLVPMTDKDHVFVRDYFLGIKGQFITKIAPWSEQKWQAKKSIHAKDKIVMPSFINGHTHLPMTLFKGLGDDLPFDQWLHEYILPLERKFLTPEFIKTGAELAALELLSFGVTTVCDMYYFEDLICDVFDKAGMRGLFGPSFSDFPNGDTASGGDQYKILDRMRETYKNHDRIVPAIAPHSPYGCGDETIVKVRDYAQKYDVPVVMHLSETLAEASNSLKACGLTPVESVEKSGLMDSPCIFAHGVHVTESDIDILVKKGASVIYNPESNMKLGVGVAPIPQMIKKGLKLGLGTDGSASNNDLSLFGAMDAGAKLQKSHNRNTSIVTAYDLLTMATAGGARALGLDKKVGTLEEGKCADLIFIDTNFPHMIPLHNVASQLVYCASGQEVDTVICHGKILVEGHKNLVLDQEKIFSKVREFKKVLAAT